MVACMHVSVGLAASSTGPLWSSISFPLYLLPHIVVVASPYSAPLSLPVHWVQPSWGSTESLIFLLASSH